MLHIDPGKIAARIAEEFTDGRIGETDVGANTDFAAGHFGAEFIDIIDGH